MITLLVALAGGAGAVVRAVVDGVVARHNRLSMPLGTFVINVTGSFLLGVLNNSLNMIGLSPYSQRVVKGIILLVALLIGYLRKNSR